MTERDTDFEFDFFDEPETDERTEPQRPRLPRRGGPRRPLHPPTGLAPILRLVVAVAVAILIVVLLVFWVQSCQGASKKRSYRNYVVDVTKIGDRSANVGRSLASLLAQPGLKQAQLVSKVNGLAQQEAIDLNQAQKLSPPGRLREEQQHVVEALQYRLSGLAGLRDALLRTAHLRDKDRAGALLANQARRFIASDVVWDDRFKDPTKAILKDEGIGGVVVPDSNFLTNPDLASASSLASLWQRLRGAATGGQPGGVRGTRLVSVKVLPSGQTLTPGGEAIIRSSPQLAFEVAVEDSGSAQEVQLQVTLTLEKKPGPSIVRTETIPVIDPNETKTVRFTDIGEPDFAAPRTLKVAVKPVAGEKNPDNNVQTFTVTFTA